MNRRKESPPALEGIIVKRVGVITDPISVGVYPAEAYDGNRVANYVPLDIDHQPRALSQSGLVLLVTDVSARKTRAAVGAADNK